MRKLYLLALAAGVALVPAAASAQGAQAGHSWREGAGMPGPGARQVVREVRQMHRGGGGRHHGRRFGHIPRISHGGFVPGGWWGPQFVVRNWSGYGFPQPFQGGRWIRYYDDALLIDGRGRVHDSRYGYDWDRYGDRWGSDERGVPIYVGDGEYEPDDEDYDYAERYEDHRRDVIVDRRHHGGGDCASTCTRTYQGGGYGGGYGHGGYGYAYGYQGPMVVTETITTTTPVVEAVTTYEYVTEYETYRAKAAPKKRKVIRRAPAPARPGERG